MNKGMLNYLLKRVLYSVGTLLILIILTYLMMHATPGNPFASVKGVTPEMMAALNAKYGLDKPIVEQIFIFITNALRGDFGSSIKYGRDVATILGSSFMYSAELGVRAMIIAVFGGVTIGSVAAINRGKKADSLAMGIAVLGVSVPSFVFATLLQFAFLKLNKQFGLGLPLIGWNSELAKFAPAFALSLGPLATISRLTRTSMLDVLSSDYIKTAKAKGLSNRMIIWRHALRNAIMPVLTVLGPQIASILTGSFVIEKIFNIAGMGQYFVISISNRDYPLIIGTTVFFAIFLIIMILVVDILYGIVDPRINIAGKKG